MKSRAIKKLRGAVVALALVSGGIGIGMATNAHAQTAAPTDTASMVKPAGRTQRSERERPACVQPGQHANKAPRFAAQQ